jgi:type I restriction enzyme S subunit
VQQFLAEFGHIANAPEGIKRLRKLVLHLAVSGQLTKQARDEDANDFLEEINATRLAMQSAGVIRINRKVHGEKNSGSWEIPKNWVWCRLGTLCSFSTGRTPSRKEEKYWRGGEYPWFSIADLKHGQIVTASSESVSDVARVEIFKDAPSPAGSLLMSFKLTIGKLSLLGIDAYHNEAIITLIPFADVLKEYFFKCLNGFDLTAGNKAAIKGNTLNQDSLSNIFIALPPKAEIPRIVAKVDELMALCDQLEAQQVDRSKLQRTLRQSTLQALVSAQSPHELQDGWQRLQTNFGWLFSEPEDLDDIVAELRNLAVRGRLAQQSDVPTDLKQIKQDGANLRAQYIRAGIIRRQKLVDMAECEATYPNHWALTAFDDVAIVIGGVTKGRVLRGRQTMVCPYLAVANVQRG